ncbi:MAG TPA: hypothetical protein V6C65_09340 [Allocoleopsis sp.]
MEHCQYCGMDVVEACKTEGGSSLCVMMKRPHPESVAQTQDAQVNLASNPVPTPDEIAAHQATLVNDAQTSDPKYTQWNLDERTGADRRKGDRRATGLSNDYYKVAIENPTTPGQPEYVAECNDIIEALEMPYAHANVFKAIWRLCAAKKGFLKKDYPGTQYDAEKAVFFSNRVLVLETPAPAEAASDPGQVTK